MMRSTNASFGGRLSVVLREEEMAALEAFGPLARRAFNEAPLSVLAAHTLREVSPLNINLHDPMIDAALADGVRRLCVDLLLLDRERHDAELGVVPLVPRRTESRHGRRRWV